MSEEAIDLGIEDLTGAVEVGAGGFGTVYKAHQASLRRDVAVKMVTSTVKDRKVRIRFEREIQAMGMLSGHPNIVTVYDSGFTASGQPYILMDYMEQGSLGDRLDAEGTLSYVDVMELMVKVCGALETAHQAGILHRDIKPENILVSAYGEPKLGDFGIARLKGGPETGTSSLTASIEHVSPELLEAKPPSVSSDIYALGSTMFKMLTGAAAFIRPDDQSIVPALTRIRDEPVPNLRERGTPDLVCQLVEAAMAKDPANRFASSREMGKAIRSVQRQLGLSTTVLPIREEEAAAARDATRTIHSDDIAKSMEDIQALQREGDPALAAPPPRQPTGPAAVAGPPPYTGQLASQPIAPQPAQQAYAQPQAFQGGYAQGTPQAGYAAPASKPTPWGKIAAGVAGVVVVGGIGLGIAASGGDTPVVTPSTEPVVIATPTVPPTPTDPPTEEGPLPYSYTLVTDDTGSIQINAPTEWTDIEGGPWLDNDGAVLGRQIVASPDIARFRTSWAESGLIFGVSESLAREFDAAQALDAISFADQCDYRGRSDYSDPAYTGQRDDYANCGGTTASYTIVAAQPAGGTVLLLVQFQVVDERDELALAEALRTFVIPPPAEDGQ